MAKAKLCALLCFIIQLHVSQAIQVCLGNGNINPTTATLTLQPGPCQPVSRSAQPTASVCPRPAPCTSQQPTNINVPIQFHQMHLQPLDTSVGPVHIPLSSAKICQNNPTISLTLATPAASPVTSLMTKCGCNKCGQPKVIHQPVPNTATVTSPVTLSLTPYTFNQAVQSQPCVPCRQTSAPIQVSIDPYQSQPKCTCAQNAAVVQRQPYVLANQGSVPVRNQGPNVRQEAPLPYVYTQAQQYATKPTYQVKSPIASVQGSKTSNLKMILPLLFNLIKEKKLNCGCQSNCNCGHYGNFEPQIYSGYSNNVNYGPGGGTIAFNQENFDPFVYPGDFRDRKTNKKNSSAGEVNESNESEQSLETTTSNTISNDSEE